MYIVSPGESSIVSSSGILVNKLQASEDKKYPKHKNGRILSVNILAALYLQAHNPPPPIHILPSFG